ncbi:unnamed protein product [Hymenolepis diminuta]|uniref:Uncharacterized protein n=1 Tax=Hymenolepis diminuta TaxID=6216 RepID=A0A564Y876_HYMDI|nr:unnamed protein product [Hymenolepis diminuta]
MAITNLPMEDDTQSVLFDALRYLLLTTGDIQNATAKDSVLKRVMKYICTELPKSNQVDNLLQLHRRRDNLFVINACLMFADCVFIPSAL